MTLPRLGFILLSLPLVLPRLTGSDSPAMAEQQEERATDLPEAKPAAQDRPIFKPPANPTAVSSNDASANAKPHSMLQSALRESFRYDPEMRAKNPAPSPTDQTMSDTPDPDVVVLPKVDVSARPLSRDLPAAIAAARSHAPQNHSKFGTGVHEKDFGKVRASVVTILYIPVFLGLSW